MKDEEWEDVIDTNLNGMYRVTKAVVEKMISKKNCAIVNVSSVSGIAGNPGQTNYSATKGGIIAFTKALALELGRYKIRVNCVAPGLIESEMTEELPLKELKKGIPLRRIGKPEDVSEVVLFLADKASYITAETINISGGMVR
jgi:3-oxoacyl-[acyl-carrier protein] reductase